MNYLQTKQQELNDYVLKMKGISLVKNGGWMSEVCYANAMLLALLDEVYEANESPNDIEEFVDVAHFVLTLANYYGVVLPEPKSDAFRQNEVTNRMFATSLDTLSKMLVREMKTFKFWSDKPKPTKATNPHIELILNTMMSSIYQVMANNGLDLKTEYMKKNQINFERQNNGY